MSGTTIRSVGIAWAVVSALYLAGCRQDGAAPKAPAEAPKQAPAAGEMKIAQTVCPVMGETLKNYDIYVDHEGRRAYLCCRMCVEEFKKDPAKYIAILDEHLKSKSAPQAGAPATGPEGHTH